MNYFGRGNLELAPWFLRYYEAAGQLASQSDQPTAMIVTNQKESFTTCVHVTHLNNSNVQTPRSKWQKDKHLPYRC